MSDTTTWVKFEKKSFFKDTLSNTLCVMHSFSIVREKKIFALDLDLLWINTSTNFKCHHAKCQYTNNVHNAGKRLQGDDVVLIMFLKVICPVPEKLGFRVPDIT